MEKRVLLAVFLSFLVLFVYQSLVPKPQRPAAPREPQARPPSAPAAAAPQPAPLPPLVQPLEPVQALVSADAERDIVVETSVVHAVFTTRGAELKSWQLKQYRDDAGVPLDMVPHGLPVDGPRPFSLAFDDADLTRRVDAALYKPSADRLVVGGRAETLTFEYRDEAGVSLRKSFTFEPQAYVVVFSATVEQNGEHPKPRVEWGPGLGNVAATTRYAQAPQGIYYAAGKVARLPATAVARQPVYEGRFEFAGVDDHYFIAVALPGDRNVRVEYAPVPVPETNPPRSLMAFSATFGGAPAPIRFVVGPKDFDTLAAINRDLVRAINFGMFAPVVVPLLRSLKWVNGFVGNYGWSIIILTVLINAAMFPLRHKSVVSMRKLQELQPEIKAIQDRYAKLKVSDPARQKMNAEMMNLYRERGVNPAGGCLPMLLTLPVLFAFYSLLSVSIELRGAPFILWIRDLSSYDRLFVTPVLMGATMVWQQRMTPSTVDPVQQKMMMLMPVVFTFTFLWAPSGLVIYWLVSNVWGIGQQYATNWIIGRPVVRTARPPAERRVKTVGSGKTEAAKEQARQP